MSVDYLMTGERQADLHLQLALVAHVAVDLLGQVPPQPDGPGLGLELHGPGRDVFLYRLAGLAV